MEKVLLSDQHQDAPSYQGIALHRQIMTQHIVFAPRHKSVSKAKEDFPEPLTPVKTIS